MLAVTAIYAGCAVLLFQRWKLEGLAAAFPLAQTIQLLLLSWQQPHELRTITRQGVQYAVGLVLLALSTSALVVAANRLTGARVSGGTLENLLACIIGGLVILACFVGGARLLRLPEGILVERWMRTAIQAPVRLVAWTKDW
jgi:peptidoglycan biosynthesis protein MviN/MurJ (putative lipid II flippase)